MKQLIFLTACLVLTWLVSITSCKKNKDVPANPPPINRAPIARAGADVSVSLLSCSDRTGFAELDGSSSSDPDGNISKYTWAKIYGLDECNLINPISAKARVENMPPGEYAFELIVKDAGDLASRDTLLISVKGPPPKEYDLDITSNSPVRFTDNYADCYYQPCSYYDLTIIEGKGSFLPFGEFNIHVYETADTAALSDVHNTYIHINGGTGNSEFLNGACSINFKKLIGQGGGAFTGTFQINNGSASSCDANVFTNLPLLTVTGSLNLAAQTATIRIKGKVFF